MRLKKCRKKKRIECDIQRERGTKPDRVCGGVMEGEIKNRRNE